MTTIGISAFHHDSAACLIKNSNISKASHEERFSRIKYDNTFPIKTLKWLQKGLNTTDRVVFYDNAYSFLNKRKIKQTIKKHIHGKYDIEFVEHHKAHAMSAIATTNWTSCAVMVVDTIGGNYSTSLGIYKDNNITWLKRFEYPNSLGLFYSAATRLLGFTSLQDECKVMSAALYGNPKWVDYIEERIFSSDHKTKVNLEFGVGIGSLDYDIAASTQAILEKTLLKLTQWLFKETGEHNLAYAGGVALNCVANSYLLLNSPFLDIAIPTAAGDAGASLGAAALFERPSHFSPYLGFEDYNPTTFNQYVDALLQNKVIGTSFGKAEFGPRALGNRSLLCLPTEENIKKLNYIKGRKLDTWRPYAPVVLDTFYKEWFTVPWEKDTNMLFTSFCDNTSKIPGCHVKGITRLQIADSKKHMFCYYLLKHLEEKGYPPVLINTSFNIKGKPLINSLEDYKIEFNDEQKNLIFT